MLAAAAMLWGVVAAGVFLYASTERLNWSNEQTTLIESGYYDPQDTSAAPTWPWVATTVVAAAYVTLIVWAVLQRPPSPQQFRR